MHVLLAHPALDPWLQGRGRAAVRRAAAEVLAAARADLAAGGPPPSVGALVAAVATALGRAGRLQVRRVINATGIVLHTGLGRAPLAPEAAQAASSAAMTYSNLEFDLETGGRGDRQGAVSGALRALTGCEAALAVNNNAAAVLLALAALAAGREAIVSRSELVEIGGGFRIPEVMTQSGARLREVGTTNRTYARDYTAAVGADTALLLKVHQSNFRIVGFTAAPSLAELAALAEGHGLPLLYDMGSGALLPGLGGDGDVRSALAAGVHLITFSGDKLLGGPQAGILCGRADLIERCAHHPLARAVRLDKMTLAALQVTLDLYRSGRATTALPVLRMLGRTGADLRRAARALARRCGRALGARCGVTVEAGESAAGAGALPELPLPTHVVALRPAAGGAQALADALRAGTPPVVGRITAGALLLDPRTLLPEDIAELPGLLTAAMDRAPS